MDLDQVIKYPLVTEKSLAQAEQNKYVFMVGKKASKLRIKEAVQKFFKVDVLDVTVLNYKGKRKRAAGRKQIIKRQDWKKAYVTIKEGQKIDLLKEKEK